MFSSSEILDTAGTVSDYSSINELLVANRFLYWSIFLSGTIYCYARFIYEKWSRICPCLFNNCSVDL